MRRRAPFVWIASQRIVNDGDMGVASAFQGHAPRTDGENRFYYLRRTFTLDRPPENAELDITTDGRYQLFVNGQFIGRGPARSDPLHKRVDHYDDIARHLRAGENALAVLVRCYGRDNAFYMVPPPAWRECFGDGGLWLDARLGDVRVTSDEQWRALRSEAWDEAAPNMNFSLGPIEDKRAALEPDGWTAAGFDDSDWEPCHIQRTGGGGPEATMGGKWIEPFPLLLPREIPFAAERDLAPRSVIWARHAVPDASLPVSHRLYEESLGPVDAVLTEAAGRLTRDEPVTMRTTDDGDVALLLDFGQIHAGHPFVELDAKGGEVIELAVAERLPDEWVAGKHMGDSRITPRRSWHGHDAHICRYVAKPGVQRFERFDWSAVKYMQVAVRDATEGVTLLRVGSRETHYPVEERGAFASSDPLLGRLWDVGKKTLTACMHDAWIDCPSREQRQWLGDVAVEFPTALIAFGEGVVPLARQFLHHVAESQHADGLTEMFAPGDHRHGLVRIPDWSLMWILVARDQWRLAGDFETPRRLLSSMERVLDWFARFKGASGLVADLPYWRFIDWAGLGRDGESATINALYVAACRVVAEVSEAAEDLGRARRWRAEADAVSAVLAERHWDAARGVYVDMVDPMTDIQDSRVSQHANMSMILWDIAPPTHWASMIAWCTDPARVKVTKAPEIVPEGETLDPATDCVSANTFFAHFVYEALAKAGRVDIVLDEIRRRYGPMIALGATTLWESYSPAASLCHGFSAAPLWQMSASILGICAAAPGYAKVAFSPDLADLDFARGTVPTAAGDIAVELSREGDRMIADVTAPAGVAITPMDSGGWRFAGDAEQTGAGRHRFALEAARRG